MASAAILKKARQFLYNIKNAKKRKFYTDLMFPRDDYYLRYFGHQYGYLTRKDITNVFPNIHGIKDITLHRIFDLEPGTSLETKELAYLIAIAKIINAKHIIEIGTYNGNTALNLAANMIDAQIITVDLPPDVSLSDIPVRDQNISDQTVIGSCFKGTVHEKNIKQVLANSMEYDWGMYGKTFDLIFIDGCHHEAYVRKDTKNAIEHISNRGVVIWHDYGQSKGVSTVVDETATHGKLNIFAIRGTRFAIGLKK